MSDTMHRYEVTVQGRYKTTVLATDMAQALTRAGQDVAFSFNEAAVTDVAVTRLSPEDEADES